MVIAVLFFIAFWFKPLFVFVQFFLADSPPVTVTATDREAVASNTATITTAVSSVIFLFYWFCTVQYSTVQLKSSRQ